MVAAVLGTVLFHSDCYRLGSSGSDSYTEEAAGNDGYETSTGRKPNVQEAKQAERSAFARPPAATSKPRALGHCSSHPASSTPLKNLFWLHFPKAGTSFGATALYYACPRLPQDAIMPEVDGLTPAQEAVFTGSLIQLFLDEHKIGDPSRPGYLRAQPDGSSETDPHYCNAEGYEKERKVVAHFPIEPELAESKRGIAMFRRPVERGKPSYRDSARGH